jgi:hypothetical protein
MTDPVTQHLYVMQNEFGCIKVGRSVNPWERRLSLRKTEHCRVELVIAFEGGGEDEEAIHYSLRKHHLFGEWFDGTAPARKAVERTFKPNSINWLFEYDPVGAAEWLQHMDKVRAANKIRNSVTREIGLLTNATEPYYFFDLDIFEHAHRDRTGHDPVIVRLKRSGPYPFASRDPETGELVPIPRYTASVEDALLAWPDDLRPGTWEGTAIECCIGALRALRLRLPKVPRPGAIDEFEGTQ